MIVQKRRVEFDHSTHIYTIHRPATSERAEVHYYVSELEVMSKADPEGTLDGPEAVLALLHDERVDGLLRPTRRREAIEHTRKINDAS